MQKATGDGVALLLAGWHQTTLPQHGDSVRAHVISPLRADLLLYLTYRHNEGCGSIETCGLASRLAKLPVTRMELEQMPTIGELLAELEQLPHWPRILRAFNSSRHWRGFQRVVVDGKTYLDHSRPRNVTCVRRPWHDGDERRMHDLGMPASPYVCEGLKEWGNTIFAPVIGPSNFNTLWQIHAQQRVHRLLVSQERRRHAPYSRVIVSRIDYTWVTDHPPLHLMHASCAWIPEAEDYGGLNDRHAVLSRAHADAYLSRWELIRTGRLLELLPQLRSGGGVSGLSGERALSALLHALDVPVCRFPPTSFLACCASSTPDGEVDDGNLQKPQRGARASSSPRRCHNAKCTRIRVATTSLLEGSTISSVGPLEVKGKYMGELRSAVLHGLALQLPGARWALAHTRPQSKAKPWAITTAGLFVVAPECFAGAFNQSVRRAFRGKGVGRVRLRWER